MIILRYIVLTILFILSSFTVLWMIFHKKSFDKVIEWCVYGTSYEESDLHKEIMKLQFKQENV